MRRWITFFLSSAAVGVMVLSSPQMLGQSKQTEMEMQSPIVQQVRKKIGGLTDYDVFDWITFQVHGSTLVLQGYASRPILKSEAGRVAKDIHGIETVDNEIKVLPLSPMDNRIRRAVYDKIYRNPALSRYNANQGGYRSFGGPMMDAVINNPPIGFHAIHIIVDNGHVTLYGVVDSKGDATIAKVQADTVSGVFSVNSDLIVAPKS
ncbi:MAG: BON domain-containing protein [Acidobacteriaceae bacterium]